MPITQTTPTEEINSYIQDKVERLKKALIYNLQSIGEMAVSAARQWEEQTSPYQDQTGNLRSSIGYVIVVDGNVVHTSSFPVVKGSKADQSIEDGSKVGKDYALSLVKKFPKGVTLIVVAGMNYASYVSDKGYDVLESGELIANKEASRLLKKLGFK